jgi:hypothetical protein
MNNKKIIFISLAACLTCSVVGYFCLLIGGHTSHDTREFSLFLIPGYILMWPALLFGLFQNTTDWVTGWATQIIGYLFMGYVYSYAHKTVKNK